MSKLEYYRRFERNERALAEKASDPRIKLIHLELARGYAQLAGHCLAKAADVTRTE